MFCSGYSDHTLAPPLKGLASLGSSRDGWRVGCRAEGGSFQWAVDEGKHSWAGYLAGQKASSVSQRHCYHVMGTKVPRGRKRHCYSTELCYLKI